MRPINISGSRAINYYYDHDPFFNRVDQKNSLWLGKLSSNFGLTGTISKEDFSKILEGQDLNGKSIIKKGHGINKKAQYKKKHRAAVDIAFATPKSVSILAFHCGHEKLIDAHRGAVKATVQEIENEFIQARFTKDKKTNVVDSQKGIFALFDHSISRANDPQLHTHCLIMNMCETKNGHRAIYNDLIFRHQRYINSFYQQSLAKNISDLGYSIETKKGGTFEIKGLSENTLKLFSKRTDEIEKKEKELKKLKHTQGLDNAVIRNKATIESRQSKDKHITPAELKTLWEQQKSSKSIERSIENRKNKRLTPEKIIAKATEQLHKTESSFNRFNLLDTAFKLSRGTPVDELKTAFENECQKGLIQSVGKRINKAGVETENYASRRMIQIEKAIVNYFKDGLNAKSPEIADIEKHLKPYEYFTAGQKALVKKIFFSNDRYNLVQGDAGTGKTSALKGIREIAEKQKCKNIIGLAFTGKATSEIENQAGIQSKTIDQLLSEYNKRSIKTKAKDRINGKYSGIWLVDESSMIGSEQLLKLMNIALYEDAKVFFIGDKKQLQAIAAGKMFKHLQEIGQAVELTESMRQKQNLIKEAVTLVKDKKIKACLDLLNESGNVFETDDINKMIDDYISSNGDMIITARNADREQINKKCRHALKARGLINSKESKFQIEKPDELSGLDRCNVKNYSPGQEIIINQAKGIQSGSKLVIIGIDAENNRLTVRSMPKIRVFNQKKGTFKHIQRKKIQTIRIDPMKADITPVHYEKKIFSVNDRVVFLKNDRDLNVKNGHTGTIKKVSSTKMSVYLQDQKREVTFNHNDYASIDHGYALTAYKSQGQTAKNIFVYAGEQGHNTEFLYTALSRASETAKIYCENFKKFAYQCSMEQEKETSFQY
ncbi:exonuclease v subunit alpha [Candidatus Magnetomorum sp. HK-1]|nr:exonuclease v subunit alpha [Candidatus Magnetomorum sp. HK-1]